MPRRAAPKMGDMTVAQLLQLRDKVQTSLSRKVMAERRELEHKIGLLSKLESSAPQNGQPCSLADDKARLIYLRGPCCDPPE